MALIKSSLSFGITFMIVACLVQRSFQVCTKPSNLDPNVVINPDQQSYYTYYYFDVSCQPGYDKNGPDRCYCTPGSADDYWYPDPGAVTCAAYPGCSRPVFTNPYAILLNPDQPTYQTYYRTELTCEDGHTSRALPPFTYCNVDNTWDPDPSDGLCYAQCNTTELLDDNIVATNSSDGAQTIFDHSEVAYFSCRDNLAFTGQDSATCINGSFHFTDAPRCLGCSRPVFTNPYAIVLNPDQPTYLTYYLTTLSCKDGHTSSGLPSVTYCIIDGTWDPDPAGGLCYAQCNTTELIDDGVVATERNQARQTIFDHGENAYFSCQDNFTFTGQASATCINGSFDFLEEPECLGCSIPSVQPNVAIEPQVSSYDVNFKVTLSCVGDRTPNGPEFSYCNRGNHWEPDPKTLTCHEQCKSPALSDPRVIHTSNLSGSSGQAFYLHADSISFSCADGIYLDGLQRATCHNGQWYPRINGYDTVCKDNCTSPPNMSNMGVMFRHGESHVFECDVTPGMIRMGGPKSVCNDGRWKPRVQCALPQDLRSDL